MENLNIPKDNLLKGFYLYTEKHETKEKLLKFLYEKTLQKLYYFQFNVKLDTGYAGNCTVDISFSLEGYYCCLENKYHRHDADIELETLRHYLCDLIELGMVVAKKTWKKRILKDFDAKCKLSDFVCDLQHILRNIDK